MRMAREMRVPELDGDTADLLITVEEIRRSRYPDLDADLVGDILGAQYQFAEDRAEARKRTEQVIKRWAARQPASEAD
jgi:FKBP-type peptidyl-prolyl cis-trans isomerase (trigger factor)